MRWFSEAGPFAPVCDVVEECSVPVGDRCQYCHKEVKADERGFELPVAGLPGELQDVVYYHQQCLLRNVGVS